MRSRAAHGPLIVLVGLVLTLSVVGAAAAPPGTPAGEDPVTTMRIDLRADGDADWAVTLAYPIDSDEERDAYDRLHFEFVNGEADPISVIPFRRAANLSSATTGREMRIENPSRRAGRSDGVGRLTITFQWTNFTEATDDRLLLGDVFRTPEGSWLPQLADNQTLLIDFPDRYAPRSLSWPLRNGTITIVGPVEFDPGQPSVTLALTAPVSPSPTAVPTSIVPTTARTSPTETRTATPVPNGGYDLQLGLLTVLILLAALGYLLWRRRGRSSTPADSSTDPTASTPADGPAEEGVDPVALLSDEERVLRLLRENGGRMRQVSIVEETDWSNAKVSQLLSEMAEADRIEKLRIGRENLISLPDHAPDETG